MRTLVVFSLFLAGCLAQSGIGTTGVNTVVSPFQPGTQWLSGTQPGSTTFQTGTGTQFTTGGVAQPGVGTPFTPGGFVQPGATGGFVQPGTTGGFVQPGTTGGFVQPGATGGFVQPGTQLQPGVSPGIGSTFQPGMTVGSPGIGSTFQPGMTVGQPGLGTSFQPGVGTQPGMVTPLQPGLQPGMVPTQTGMGTSFQPGVTTSVGGLNPALQAQILAQGSTTGGFGTMGPFAPGGVPGTTGFVGSQFGTQPGFTGPFGTQMQVPLSPMAALMMSLARNPNNYRYATCMFNDTMTTVKGRIDFRQFLIGEGRQQVNVRIQLAGLPPSTINVERGMHVHEFGDIGDMCSRVGPHFNPNQTPHGSRRNFAIYRHVGDLGNIVQSQQGLASTQFSDQSISLEGVNNIVGRSVVITQERDDLGFGGNSDSTINGNARTPLACCTIGRTTSRNWFSPLSANDLQNMAMTQILPDETFPQFNSGTNMNIINNGMVNPVNPNSGGFVNPQVSFSPTSTNGQSFVFATGQGKK